MTSRLREAYKNEMVAKLREELGLPNVMMVPRLEKVVINSGMGEATQNAKLMDTIADELTAIAGQKPSVRKAKKSIANFRLRQACPSA